MNKMALGAVIQVMHRLSNMDFYYPRLTWLRLVPVECQICQQQRSTLSPLPGMIPWGDLSAPWWQVDYTGPLPLLRSSVLFSLKYCLHFGYSIVFPAHTASAKTTIYGIFNTLENVKAFHLV